MSLRFNISVLGDKKLEKVLREFDRKTESKIVRPALRQSYKIVFDEVKSKAPVLTGRLKRGIKLKALKRSRRWVGVQVVLPDRRDLGIPENYPAYYPAMQEYRHRSWIRPAHDHNKERVLGRFRRIVWRGVLRTWRGLKP